METGGVGEQLPLRPNGLQIPLSLAGDARHGCAIVQEVAERTGGRLRPWPATLYGTMRTPFGRRLLAAETRRLEGLVPLARARGVAGP